MSGNKTLLAPEVVTDIQATTVMPENAEYTYQRADGTVERAMSAEDAIARCPVLGRLAIEAPNQANILLELAIAGKEKMQAEEKQQKSQLEEKAKVDQKPEPKAEAMQETKLAKSEPPNPILIDKQSEVFQAIKQESQQNEKPLSIIPSVLITEKVIAVQQRTELDNTFVHQEATTEKRAVSVIDEQHIEQQQTEALVYHHQHNVSQEQLLADKPENGRLPDLLSNTTPAQGFEPEVLPAVYEHEPAPADTNPDVFQQVIDIVDTQAIINSSEDEFDFEVIDQDDELEMDTHILPLAETDEANGIEVLKEQNKETEEQLALQFEPEVIDTYKELLVILENEISEPHEPNISATQLDDKTNVQVSETVALEGITQDFETFLVLQLKAEEVVPLETIIEQADEQSLEQTLVQLAWHLADNLEENHDASKVSTDALPELSDERIELNTILQEISAIQPTCYNVNEQTKEKHIQITPEMTQKLLNLLCSLGYEQPKEVLVEFVRLHGLGFLLQAIQYIYQLNSEDNRHEFLTTSASITTTDDYYTPHLFGKIALSSIKVHVVEPIAPFSYSTSGSTA